jgi:RimJ/RimL family protein N-acetyltransferase
VPALAFPDPPLTDGVVALRPWRDEDAAGKVAWARDADIVRFTGVSANYSAEAALAWAAGTEAERRAGRTVALAVVDAVSGAVLGSCDLRRPDAEDPALGEIGYLLAPAARGRGAMSRALALLVGWGFETLGLERVQALVHPENPRSAAVLERVGFRHEGVLRGYRPWLGAREDRVMFAVLRGELARAPGGGPRARRGDAA